ncbi:MBL fold metallo-hydrolase [Salinadaptatus halalkaliphilus]|uniref:MBL fold metallo-hydrolase n=1 Tax=Salinadaptatus halalkaliphilus TaxID=2419781 RepID=A0A4S3TH89_9EURY|nr:MBL fold metallo-hydrolase [Salinadaptatus halalkaliphilus]THE62850.1 MBL fold metallo-hydrolase [Salinadaptatus halalkaliphilus]
MQTDADGLNRDGRSLSAIQRLEFEMPWPPDYAAAYVLDGPEPVLIDAGTTEATAESTLLDGLDAIGYTPSDIEHVLVTHVHSDHIGLVALLREAGSEIHAPRAALDRLATDPETLRRGVAETARSAGYRGDELEAVVESELESFRRDRRLLDPSLTRPIDPSEPLTIGDREFTPFETPGHEIHHLCLEVDVDGTRVLFSGDTLIEPFRAGAFDVGIDRGAYDAVADYYLSMDRLTETTATRVYPGHGPVFEEPHDVVETTRERLDELLAETLAALRSIEPATPLAVAENRVGELRSSAPLLDTLGALGTLTDRGTVTYDVADGVRRYRSS